MTIMPLHLQQYSKAGILAVWWFGGGEVKVGVSRRIELSLSESF